MKLFILLLNVAWLVLTTAEPAHAGPLIGIFSAISTAIAGAGAITKIVLGLVFNVAVSLLQKALTKTPQQKAIGVKLDINIGDDIPVSTVIGYYPTAGKRNYVATWGDAGKTPNAYLTQPIELGNLPMSKTQLQDIDLWVDDQKVTILFNDPLVSDKGYPIKEFRETDDKNGGNVDYAWIKFYNGTQTAADPFLLEHFGDLEDRPWLPTMIGRGVPYAIMTYRYQPRSFSTVPDTLFVTRGIPLYDIRKDSTNGGIGPQRWDDQSTWEPSVNAVVLTYNVIRGLRYGNDWFFGGQDLAASRLPSSNWIAAANEAGRLIEIPGAQTEPQFRAGLEITGDMVPLQVIDTLREAANARLAEVGGVFKIQVGAFGAAVFSFGDQDIQISKGQSFDPFPTLDKTVNQINISYPNPDEKWVTKDAPALSAKSIIDDVTGKSLFEIDGNRVLPADVELPAVPFPRQAQRIRRAMIKEERRFRTHRFWLPPEAWVLEPNDVVAWTSVRNGYVNKKFIIVDIQGEVTMNQLVVIREIDPADYDWSPSFELPTSSGYLGPMLVPAQPMTGWEVEAGAIEDANGGPRRPAINVRCAANLDDVKRVAVEVRLAATGAVVFKSDQYAYAADYEWPLSGAWCLPGTAYEVRGKLVPYSSRDTLWSGWMPVTTYNYKLALDDLEDELVAELGTLRDWIADDVGSTALETAQALAQEAITRAAAITAEATARAQAIAEEAQARVTALAAQSDALSAEQQARIEGAISTAGRYRALVSQIAEIRDAIVNLDVTAFDSVQTMRTALTQTINGVSASFTDKITIATAATAALAVRTTTLEATTGNLGAQITQSDQARVEGLNALAQRLSLLSAGTDNQFDPAKFWNFDLTVEGWSGNGAPTATVDGYLRPADHATDPYVVSPSGLAVNANTYRQIRARIVKFGTPVWEGKAWWHDTIEPTWDAGRCVTIVEPAFDTNNVGLITFTMPWTGTIDQIRLDLSTAQTAGNGYLIDWASIGSPSPGASRAELAAEQTARISATNALAQSIVALEAGLSDTTSGLTGLAGGVSVIAANVGVINSTLTAQSAALDAVNAELLGKASSDALDQLETTVEAINDDVGSLMSLGKSVRAVRSKLLPEAMAAINLDFANFLDGQKVRETAASASQTLLTKIDTTNTSLSILGQAVLETQAALAGLASTQTVQALTSRVTVTETKIQLQAEALLTVQSDLVGKASATAVSDLTTRVLDTETEQEVQSGALLSIAGQLVGKADASVTLNLTQRMTAAETNVANNAAAVTAINLALPGKASQSAVNTLSGTVSAQGATIAAQSDAVLALQGVVAGKADASVTQTLTQRITATELTVSNLGSAVTQINLTLPGKANTSDVNTALASKAALSLVNSLTGTVTAQGNTINTQGDLIAGLTSTVAGKADASVTQTLSQRLTSTETDLSNTGAAVTQINLTLANKANTSDVNNALASKASVSLVNSLTGTVNAQGDTINLQGGLINGINVALAGKASTAATADLDSRINQVNGRVDVQSTAIISAKAQVDGITADARLKAQVIIGDNALTRIGLYGSNDSGGVPRAVGLYLDVPTDPGLPTKVLVDAGKFGVINGNEEKFLFLVDGNGVYMNSALIPVIHTDRIVFGDNSVQTSALQQGAAVQYYDAGSVETVTMTSVFQGIVDVDVPITSRDAVQVTADLMVRATALVGGKAFLQVELREDNVMVKEATVEFSETGFSKNLVLDYTRRTSSGTFNYKLVVKKSSTNENFFIGRRVISAPVFKKAR